MLQHVVDEMEHLMGRSTSHLPTRRRARRMLHALVLSRTWAFRSEAQALWQGLLMLIQEAMAGCTDGNVDPVVLTSLTTREVRAGRMSPNDEFHKLAISGIKPPSLGARLRSWFK